MFEGHALVNMKKTNISYTSKNMVYLVVQDYCVCERVYVQTGYCCVPCDESVLPLAKTGVCERVWWGVGAGLKRKAKNWQDERL